MSSFENGITQFKNRIWNCEKQVETYSERMCGSRPVAPHIEMPIWLIESSNAGAKWRTRMNCLGMPVLQLVFAGWKPPTLNEVIAHKDEELLFKRTKAFWEAVGAIGAEFAIHSRTNTRVRAEPPTAQFRMVDPTDIPESARALVPAAQEACTMLCITWLGYWARRDSDARSWALHEGLR